MNRDTLRAPSTTAFYWRLLVRPYGGHVLVILLLMLAGAVLDMAAVGLTVPLVDTLLRPDAPRGMVARNIAGVLEGFGMPASSMGVIFALLVIVSVLFVVQSAFTFLNQFATNVIAVRLRRQLKGSLFAQFLRGDYETVTRYARGVVLHHINNPSMDLYKAILSLGQLATASVKCVIMIGLMLYLSWWATVAVGVLALLGIQGWRLYANRRSVECGRAIYDTRAEQSKLEMDAIDGLRVVKAQGVEGRTLTQHDALLVQETRPLLRLVAFRHGPHLVNEVVAACVVLGLGAVVLFVPSLGIRFSMLVAFLIAVRRIAPAMASINGANVELSKSRRLLEAVDEVLRLPQEPSAGAVPGPIQKIRFKRVDFTYASRPDQPVLREVEAVLRRGILTAVVGPTGAGKSTLANLLLALYRPASGEILVDGVPLTQLDRAAWRRHIGYVSQDIFVFNASIRENIALGESVSEAQVVEAAQIAQLDAFIQSLPQAYDTVVGDRGLRLSGGQCQRVAIARAILRRPPVLIFDEATSALDNITERAVYSAISALRRDAIVLLVAHRLSTVKDADHILVLRDGRIVETGTHETLLRRGGAYAALYAEREHSERESGLVGVHG